MGQLDRGSGQIHDGTMCCREPGWRVDFDRDRCRASQVTAATVSHAALECGMAHR